MYEEFIRNFSDKIQNDILTGKFGASMEIKLVNDGPVTIWVDSKNRE